MENNLLPQILPVANWFSEEFISAQVVKFLKENGYKVHREPFGKDHDKSDKIITASKYFRKEIIEVKGFPTSHLHSPTAMPAKNTHAKSWFTEALFNSFVNFSSFENAEVAMALPNVGRYQAIIRNLNDYFTVNNLFFRIYLVNENGSVEVSNLNQTYLKTGS